MDGSWLRGLGVLVCFVAAHAFSAPPLLAGNGDRPYSGGPVTGDDFKGDPPPPEDRPTGAGGVPIVAMIATGVSATFEAAPDVRVEDGKTIVELKTQTVRIEAFIDRTQSWIDPEYKDDKRLLDHEQGHPDNAERIARRTQAEMNRKRSNGGYDERSELPADATREQVEAELERQRKAIAVKVAADEDAARRRLGALDDAYDRDTLHGTDPKQQARYRKLQRKALRDPNTDPKRKKGRQAESRSADSIGFDATTGLLTIDGDIIVGILGAPGGVPADPIVGAELAFPEFGLAGQTFDGLFFFSALGPAASLAMTKDDATLMTLSFESLLYDPGINLFYGLGADYAIHAGGDFLLQLDALLSSGGLLAGVELTPDEDFMALTAAFTQSGRSPITNGFGARSVAPVPIPPAGVMLGLAIGALALGARRAARLA